MQCPPRVAVRVGGEDGVPFGTGYLCTFDVEGQRESVHFSRGTGLTKSPRHVAAGNTFPADSAGCTAEGKSSVAAAGSLSSLSAATGRRGASGQHCRREGGSERLGPSDAFCFCTRCSPASAQSGIPTLKDGRSRHKTTECNIKQSNAPISTDNMVRTPAIGRADWCGFVTRDFVMSELAEGDSVLLSADLFF